jgi:hypothetical protein
MQQADDEPTAPAGLRLVVDRIAESYTPGSQPGLGTGAVDRVVIHRCDLTHVAPWNPTPIPTSELDGPMLAGRFRSPLSESKGWVPYSVVVPMHGRPEQILPLRVKGAHAVGYNWCSWGVAVLNDGPATEEQLDAAARVTARLVVLARGASVVGHTELPGASRDKNKVCPAPVVNMADFRARVRRLLPAGWQSWGPHQAEAWAGEAGLVL